jgi:uncharacterized membrane-anchored protein YitT (DUF2179 family)
MTVGIALTAWALDAFLIPNKIAAGGVSGLATVLYYVIRENFGITVPIAWQMLAMNSVLLLVGMRVRGLQYVAKTVYGIFALSFFIGVLDRVTPTLASGDLLLAALYGGALTGVGMGMVFKAGGNTGGTDIVAQLLARKLPFGVGQIMLVVDAMVTLLAALAFGPELALYGAVAIFVGTSTIDLVLEGISVEKAVWIISEEHDRIADAVIHDMGRGATTLQATGVFTGESRRVLWVVLSRNEIDSIKQIVATLDPTAMVIISNVHETIGEGFKEMRVT